MLAAPRSTLSAMVRRSSSLLLRDERPPSAVGVVVAAFAVALTTLAIYPLRSVMPAVSTGVVYLLAVLLVSTWFGMWLGLATAVASALAFNWFHLPPTGRLEIANSENVVALCVFLIAAVCAAVQGTGRHTQEALFPLAGESAHVS